MRTLQMIDPLPLKLGRKVTNVISPAYEAALKAHEARKSELFAFLGKCDPHITEADCRKRKDAPAEQPKQSTDAPKFKVGDRVRSVQGAFTKDLHGVVTVVDMATGDGTPYQVAFDRGPKIWKAEEHLELIPTKLAPQEPQADADGWIPHNPSKPCPVPAGTFVKVRLRNGATYAGRALTSDPCVGASQWTDDGSWLDAKTIVAYRIVA